MLVITRRSLTWLTAVSLACAAALFPSLALSAELCTPDTLAAAVDSAGAELREFTANAQPKLKKQLKALQEKKGWSDEGYEEQGLDLIRDDRIRSLDEKADELLTRIDSLGRVPPGTSVRCETQDELRAAASELLAVMRTKTVYIEERVNRELGTTAAANAPSAPAARSPPAETPVQSPPAKQAPVAKAPPTVTEAKPAEKKDVAALPPAPSRQHSEPAKEPWTTSTEQSPQPPPEPYPAEAFSPPPQASVAMQPPPAVAPEGYSIEEIREASRGFFGTVSTGLASVIEHAFSKSGRPAAYVLGTEGGGALLAGLRYGSGTMYLRNGGTRPVFWHGPSLGYDVGAEGSRTLFLIYRLDDPESIYRRFTGIDGSAYLVGGVGMTFLKGGDVLMAPIRSGLGLRLGASVGYVRFTPRPTWNPF